MSKTPVLLTIAFCACFTACKKNDGNGPVILSSEKTISSIVFKLADNPGLSADVAGVITTDSVKVEWPGAIALNSAVPTISFSGKSINPANKTAQNFNNPVTYTITAEDGTTKNYVFKVNRPQTDTATLISGKWGIFRDSVGTADGFFIVGQGIITPGVYYGVPADYYDFRVNGDLLVHENGYDATTTYQVLPNSKLFIPELAVFDYNSILKLTATEAIFYWTSTSANGGKYARKLELKK
ncbi:MAG: hypothetical protein ABI707_17360 [Ferruginibacter sp.]